MSRFLRTTLLDYYNLNRELIEGLLKINHKNFKTYQIVDYFCKNVCKMADNTGKPLYFDNGRLTLTGNELLRGVFEQVVATSLNHTNLK